MFSIFLISFYFQGLFLEPMIVGWNFLDFVKVLILIVLESENDVQLEGKNELVVILLALMYH